MLSSAQLSPSPLGVSLCSKNTRSSLLLRALGLLTWTRNPCGISCPTAVTEWVTLTNCGVQCLQVSLVHRSKAMSSPEPLPRGDFGATAICYSLFSFSISSDLWCRRMLSNGSP